MGPSPSDYCPATGSLGSDPAAGSFLSSEETSAADGWVYASTLSPRAQISGEIMVNMLPGLFRFLNAFAAR